LVRCSLALALALAAAAPGAAAGGATQEVRGTVTAQFGFGVAADGRLLGSASTIPVSVSRERRGGMEIVTIVPLK
jgi:hypothetical protein